MRVAVLSDIHGNLAALEAVLADIGTVDAVWHLGDVVGYGPEPDGVVERLRDLGVPGVRGNHDAAAVGGDEIEYFNPDARRAMEWTRATIAASSRRWLAALPERLVVGDFTLVHGSPREPVWEYVLSSWEAAQNLAAFETPFCLHGHTHVPVLFRAAAGASERMTMEEPAETALPLREGRALVNPGSVGQPRDGDPRASYLLLDTEAGTATWRRVPYPIEATQATMRRVDLPTFLVRRLEVGI